MEKVKLITKTGELVGFVDVPPFVLPPDVLIWGARVFQAETIRKEDEPWAFREVFAYTVTQQIADSE